MKSKNKKGIGLIEIVIYVGIMGVFVAAITSFIISNQKIGNRNEAINEVEVQGNEIVDIISQEIRNAKSVVNPDISESNSSLELTNKDSNQIIFDLSGGKLRIERGSGGTTNLNSDRVIVSNLNFNNFGLTGTGGSIQFQFDARYVNPGGKEEINYTRTFSGSASLR